MGQEIFRDRREAGRRLAKELVRFTSLSDLIVLGLPRGGIPVAFEVAKALAAPLEVFVVRKLGVPGHSELAMGALASGGYRYLNQELLQRFRIPPQQVQRVIASESAELDRRERLYRSGRPPLELSDRTVIVVDDGLATGASMFAAVQAIRALKPKRIVVAVPVAAAASRRELAPHVDDFICVQAPEDFQAVGIWYDRFDQTTDEEVATLLSETTASGSKQES